MPPPLPPGSPSLPLSYASPGLSANEGSFTDNRSWRIRANLIWAGFILMISAALFMLVIPLAKSSSRFLEDLALQCLLYALIVGPSVMIVARGGLDLSTGAVFSVVAVCLLR